MGALIGIAALLIISVLVWQGMVSGGVPNPTSANLTPTAAVVDTGILVFREGLEAILVLSAVTASLVRNQTAYVRPVATGAGFSFIATVITWFVVVAIISNVNAPELDIQAATGLLAIVVLLVIMNWFFHRIYWTGWIAHHNRRKRELMSTGAAQSAVYKGLLLLGFTSIYREGFEVVLFLQSIRMQVGSKVVLIGALIGLALTMIVAVLTFLSHRKLPYKKMLVLTGVMLGAVLIVMVGESVQEMQLAGWMPTTQIGIHMPGWMNLWFAVYPSIESLSAQVLAGLVVIGSYVAAEYARVWKPRKQAAKPAEENA